MGRLNGISGKEAVKAFERAGFEVIQAKGSHVRLKKVGFRMLVIPLHKEVSPYLLRDQIKRAGLTEDQFLEFLS